MCILQFFDEGQAVLLDSTSSKNMIPVDWLLVPVVEQSSSYVW